MTPQFRNPILPGTHPDPSICRVGDDYWLVHSSFEFFPGIPIFHSRDLVHWRQLGHVLTRPSQLDLRGSPASLGIFAPTLRHIGGRFHVVATNVHLRRNFIVSADRPEGPWTDPLWLDWPGIDPSLFEDADGSVFITGNGGFLGDEPVGIYQAKIDLSTGAFLSPRQLVWAGTGGHAPEGPHLYRRDGYYYLLIAEGGTEYGHMVTVARSRQVDGPFEACSNNPILSHRSSGSPIQATGHADLVQTPAGDWWAVLLGIRPAPLPFAPSRQHLGRETLLAPVDWGDDGWPRIGCEGRVHETMDAPKLAAAPVNAAPTRTHFEGPALPHEFQHLREPRHASLNTRPGWLTLQGATDTLDTPAGTPAFVGRRQQHFDCHVATSIDFDPADHDDEAGLTVYKSAAFHYDLVLARREGQRVLRLRRRVASLCQVDAEQTVPDGPLVLGVQADAEHYRFFFQAPGAEPTWLGRGECALLATEVAGGFTGVYLGLHASGGAPAAFQWLDYQPLSP